MPFVESLMLLEAIYAEKRREAEFAAALHGRTLEPQRGEADL